MEMNVSGRMSPDVSSEENGEEAEKLKTWKIGTKHFQATLEFVQYCRNKANT
jgi:hypothetical protein